MIMELIRQSNINKHVQNSIIMPDTDKIVGTTVDKETEQESYNSGYDFSIKNILVKFQLALKSKTGRLTKKISSIHSLAFHAKRRSPRTGILNPNIHYSKIRTKKSIEISGWERYTVNMIAAAWGLDPRSLRNKSDMKKLSGIQSQETNIILRF
jgi:hypothetical protein